MKIVIVGDGKVGYTLAQQLSDEGHDIVIIDRSAVVLQKSQELLDVMVIEGNGACLQVQHDAGVDTADLLIAATSGDEVNLLCCILARKLGCKHTIARVRNPDYEQQVRFLKEDLGLSMFINPEKAAAHEISRILQFPSFIKRDSFARGRVELVELRVDEKSPLNGITLDKLENVIRLKALICAVDRGGEVTIPSGRFQLLAGDKITVTAAANDLALLIKRLGIAQDKTRCVLIVGGSRIAEHLARELASSRIAVKIIEQDLERCAALSETLPKALVIYGNGSSQALLKSEGVADMDAVVTLTGIDEENIIISMFSNYIGVPKTITKISNMELVPMFKDKGLDSLVSPKLITANEIVRYVRAMSSASDEDAVITLHSIVGGHAEALEFFVTAGTDNLGVPLYKMPIKDNILVACISRGGTIIIPRGSDVLLEGDTVVIVAAAGRPIIDLNEIFSGVVEQST